MALKKHNTHARSRKAQMEASFQWIYVVIAGGMFLLLSFFIFRSCASSGDEMNAANAFDYGVTSLHSVVWQVSPKTEIQFPDSTAVCPAGTLTIKNKQLQKSLDRMPVFISPSVGVNTTVVTKELLVPGLSPLQLGSVAYAVDSKVQYFILEEKNQPPTGSRPHKVAETLDLGNIHIVEEDDLGFEVKKYESSDIVVVSFDNVPSNVEGISKNLDVFNRKAYFVQAKPVGTPLHHNLEFYEANSTGWVLRGYANYTNDAFLTGAVVSANFQNYDCSKNAVIDRMSMITRIYENRSLEIASSNESTLSVGCKGLHGNASSILNTINKAYSAKKYNSYVSMLLIDNSNLVSYQEAMFGNDCPVIG